MSEENKKCKCSRDHYDWHNKWFNHLPEDIGCCKCFGWGRINRFRNKPIIFAATEDLTSCKKCNTTGLIPIPYTEFT